MWPEEARHCPLCGAELVVASVQGRDRRRCGSAGCAFVLYLNPASAAAAIVLDAERRVLLVRRAIEPFKGFWALPAGYQEFDEDPTRTIVREVREEAGVHVEVVRLLDLIFMRRDYRKPANVALFLCRAVGGEAAAGLETEEVGWFDLDALPDELGFDNRRLLEDRRADLLRPSGGAP